MIINVQGLIKNMILLDYHEMIVILFFYIFGFSIIGTLTSRDLLIPIFGILYLFDKPFRVEIHQLFRIKKIIKIFILIISLAFYSIVISIFRNTYDYEVPKKLISLFLNLFLGIFVFAMYKKNEKSERIVVHLLYIFIVQSSIQFLSFSIPEVNKILDIFRTDLTINVRQRYADMRGLSISGVTFFMLAAGYGMIYILFFENIKKIFPNRFWGKILVLILLLFGGLSAGRTAIVGFGMGFGYFLYRNIINTTNLKLPKIYLRSIILGVLLSILLLSVAILILDISALSIKIQNFIRFSFEYIYNFLELDQLRTSSTDHLFNDMYFKIPKSTILFGDGFYVNSDGSYYMHTDAGYMRNILYFGIVGFVLLFVLQVYMLSWDRGNRFLSFVLLVYILVIHIKGDVLGYSTIIQDILFLILLRNIKFETSPNRTRGIHAI